MPKAKKIILLVATLGYLCTFATFCTTLISKQKFVLNIPKYHRLIKIEAETESALLSHDAEDDISRVSFNARNRVIFYNRIGKCGSRSLWDILRALHVKNNFTCDDSKDTKHDHPAEEGVLNEIRKIASMKPPKIYNRHIYYLDFNAHNHTRPIYINVIREPIQRFLSQYNYLKYGDGYGLVVHPKKRLVNVNKCVMDEIQLCSRNYTSGLMFYMGMYFCGHDQACKTQSRERVEIAKKHIDKEYTVIGTTKEFGNTALLLERMLPGYFAGAHQHWSSQKKNSQGKTKTVRKEPPLTKEAEYKLKNDLMKDEYEVYYHALAKFERLKKKYGIS